MKYKPHPYQDLAIKKIENQKSVGLFLDMGLGKTVITLTAIRDLIYDEFIVSKCLVIAPLQTAQNTWTDEVAKWNHLRDLKISLVLGSVKQRETALNTKADVYVINRENVQWLCDYYLGKEWPFDMLVVDELSSFKNPSAKRFKALRKKLGYFRRIVGLTGTPASNGYMDLWSEVYLLDKGERLGKTITEFRNVYFRPGRQNGHIVYEWMLKKGAKDIIDDKLSDLCISMKAVDWITMPERIETNVYVALSDSERRLYDKFGKEHILTDKNVIGINAAAVQSKLLQMANGFVYSDDGNTIEIHEHKIEALGELVEAAQGKPLLVFYNFVADKGRILKAFPQAVELKGREDVQAWNRGEIQMLVTHPASAGHGLNLQEGGNIIVWYGLPWSLELYQQANARLYRQGQKQAVYIYHILTKDTHDVDVLDALKEKDVTQEALLKALKARIQGWEDVKTKKSTR